VCTTAKRPAIGRNGYGCNQRSDITGRNMNGATGRRWPTGVGLAGRASGVKLLPLPSTCAFSYHNNLYRSPQSLPRLFLESSGHTDPRSSAMFLFATSQFPFTAALLLLIVGGRLEAKSVIVDDSDTSRITYSPGWGIGNDCSGCFAKPDPTQPSNGTWHECV